ncbi:MAG TPA: CAP domain-containing protein, partial [Patescibacteria group bacterium]|nr:CAP domain-containing protein [Patescibacteria group bacterium]
MPRVKNKKKLHHRLIRHAHHFLIPHSGNDHKPHALRPMALRLYTFSIIGVKLFVTTFLFLTYPSIGKFASITEAEILSYTNASRAESGVPALSLNSKLNQAAKLKAQDMIADDYFAHTAPDGTKPWEFLKQAGYSYAAAGENLAMDFTEASSVHVAFMNSPSHKKNIVNGQYTEMGVAVIDGELQGHQTTILVEFFGEPYKSAAVAETTPQQPAAQPEPKPTTNTAVNTNTNQAKPTPTPTKPTTQP